MKVSIIARKAISTFLAAVFAFSSVYLPDTAHAEGAVKPVAGLPGSQVYYINNIIIPKDNGEIRNTHQGTNGKLIVHIQDAHVNYDGQKNLAHILKNLTETYGINLVLVEGGSGNANISFLRHFSTQRKRKKIADSYLKKGKISGEEYLDIVSEPGLKLDIHGIENPALYDANLEQFLKVDGFAADANNFVNSLDTALSGLKETLYTEELRLHEEKAFGYEEGDVDIVEFCEYLMEMSHICHSEAAKPPKNLTQEQGKILRRARFANAPQNDNGLASQDDNSEIEKILKIKRLEERIDFSVVTRERDDFIKALSEKFSKERLESFLRRSLDFKAGLVPAREFYSYIAQLGRTVGIDLFKYANLRIYVYYINLFEDIDHEALFAQIKTLEEEKGASLCNNETQKSMRDVTKDLNLVKSFINLRLCPGDLKEYRSRKTEFDLRKWCDFINKIASSPNVASQAPRNDRSASALVRYDSIVDDNLPVLEKFYRIAEKRDKAFYKNAVRVMERKGAKKAVLIAGGFHTDCLMPLFKKEGYSCMVVSPKIKTKTDTALYHSILRNELTVEEKVMKAVTGLLRTRAVTHPGRTSTLEVIAHKLLEGDNIKILRDHRTFMNYTALSKALAVMCRTAPPDVNLNTQQIEIDVDAGQINVSLTTGGTRVFSIDDHKWEELKAEDSSIALNAFGAKKEEFVDKFGISLRTLLTQALHNTTADGTVMNITDVLRRKQNKEKLTTTEQEMNVAVVTGWVDNFKELYREKLKEVTGLPEHEREIHVAQAALAMIDEAGTASDANGETIFIDALFYEMLNKSKTKDSCFISLAKRHSYIAGHPQTTTKILERNASIDNVRAAIKARTILIAQSGGDCAGLNAVVANAAIEAAKKGYMVFGIRYGFVNLPSKDFRKHLIPIDMPYAMRIEKRPSTDIRSSRLDPSKDEEDFKISTDNLKGYGGLLITGGDNHSLLAIKFDGVAIPKSIDNDAMTQMLGFNEAARYLRRRFWRAAETGVADKKVFIGECMGRKAGWLTLAATDRLAPELSELREELGTEKVDQVRNTIMSLIPEKPVSIRTVLKRAQSILKKKGVLNIGVSEGVTFSHDDPLWEELLSKNASLREKIERDTEVDEYGEKRYTGVSPSSELVFAILTTNWDDRSLRTGIKRRQVRHTKFGYMPRGPKPGKRSLAMAKKSAKVAVECFEKGEKGVMVTYPDTKDPLTEDPIVRPAEKVLKFRGKLLPKNLRTLGEESKVFKLAGLKNKGFREHKDADLARSGVLMEDNRGRPRAYSILGSKVTADNTVMTEGEAIKVVGEDFMSVAVSGWAHDRGAIFEVPDDVGRLTRFIATGLPPADFTSWPEEDQDVWNATWEKIKDTILDLSNLKTTPSLRELVEKAARIKKKYGTVNIIVPRSWAFSEKDPYFKKLLDKNKYLYERYEETKTHVGNDFYKVRDVTEFLQAALVKYDPDVFPNSGHARPNPLGEAYYVQGATLEPPVELEPEQARTSSITTTARTSTVPDQLPGWFTTGESANARDDILRRIKSEYGALGTQRGQAAYLIAAKVVTLIYQRKTNADPLSANDEEHASMVEQLVTNKYTAGNAPVAVRIAALAHDIDRAFEDRRIKKTPNDTGFITEAKMLKHPQRSAELIAIYLRAANVDEEIVTDVERLIRYHEAGTNGYGETLPAITFGEHLYNDIKILGVCDSTAEFILSLGKTYDNKEPIDAFKEWVYKYRRIKDTAYRSALGDDVEQRWSSRHADAYKLFQAAAARAENLEAYRPQLDDTQGQTETFTDRQGVSIGGGVIELCVEPRRGREVNLRFKIPSDIGWYKGDHYEYAYFKPGRPYEGGRWLGSTVTRGKKLVFEKGNAVVIVKVEECTHKDAKLTIYTSAGERIERLENIDPTNKPVASARTSTADDRDEHSDMLALDKHIAALTSNDPGICANAAYELGALSNPEAIEPLMEVLKRPIMPIRKHNGIYVAEHVMSALTNMGSEQAVGAIIPYLGSWRPSLRIAAANAIGVLGGPGDIAALNNRLKKEKNTGVTVAIRNAVQRILSASSETDSGSGPARTSSVATGYEEDPINIIAGALTEKHVNKERPLRIVHWLNSEFRKAGIPLRTYITRGAFYLFSSVTKAYVGRLILTDDFAETESTLRATAQKAGWTGGRGETGGGTPTGRTATISSFLAERGPDSFCEAVEKKRAQQGANKAFGLCLERYKEADDDAKAEIDREAEERWSGGKNNELYNILLKAKQRLENLKVNASRLRKPSGMIHDFEDHESLMIGDDITLVVRPKNNKAALIWNAPDDVGIYRKEYYNSLHFSGTGKGGWLGLARRGGEEVVIERGSDVIVVRLMRSRTGQANLQIDAPRHISLKPGEKMFPPEDDIRDAMPVTKVDQDKIYEKAGKDKKETKFDKGVWVAKRGAGRRLTLTRGGKYVFKGTALKDAAIRISKFGNIVPILRTKLRTTASLHQHALRNVLSRYISAPGVSEAVNAMAELGRIPVDFMEDHDAVLDIAPASKDMEDATRRTIRFDTDIVKHFGLKVGSRGRLSANDLAFKYKGNNVFVDKKKVLLGLSVFSAMGQHHEFYHLMGLNEREAIHKTLEFYNILSDEDKEALHAILRSPYIDSGNTFSLFLKTANDSERAEVYLEYISSLTLEELKEIENDFNTAAEYLEQGETKLARDIVGEISSKYLDRIARNTSEGHENLFSMDLHLMTFLIAENKTKDAAKEARHLAGYAEKAWKWRDKFVSWLIGQNNIDLPYDREALLEVLLNEDLDPDDKRQKAFDIIKGYDRGVEAGNIDRVSDQMIEEGRTILFARMARASHNQGALVASALRLTIQDEFREKARKLKKVCDTAGDEKLNNAIDNLLSVISENRSEPPSDAMVLGAIEMLQNEIREYDVRTMGSHQAERLKAGATIVNQRGASGTSRVEEAYKKKQQRHRSKVRRMTSLIESEEGLIDLFHKAEKTDAAFVIMSQRLHPNESHLQGKMNEFLEPFLGKYPDLIDLVRTGGHNMYCSADYAWLKFASDWLEAVPLFIKERIVIENGIERTEEVIDYQALEVFFKEWIAEHWVDNISDVMDSEHAALAREVIVMGDDELRAQAEEMAAEPDIKDMEEAIRQVVINNNLQAQVGNIAAIIGDRYEKMAAEVNKKMAEDEENTRVDVVRELAVKGKNITSESHLPKRLEKEAERLTQRADKKRRDLPNLHILTTQGPGMTKTLAQTWLEETMALRNVIRSRKLEKKVEKKVAEYKKRIQAIGKKIIEEYGLWPEVEEVMATQKKSEGEAIEFVVRAYPMELMGGVADLGVLIEHAERNGRKYDPKSAEDPRIVTKYIADNRAELTKVATKKVLEKNEEEIEADIAEYRKKHSVGRRRAIEAVIKASIDYRKDIKCFIKREARKRVIAKLDKENSELNLDYRVKTYLRSRMDKLHMGMSTYSAMVDVLADEGLNHLASDPLHRYEATGGNKRYNLLYTPSRVDLGFLELLSIIMWDQLVGGDGRIAELAGRKLYELYHRGHVRSYPSTAIPETNKTAENAGREVQVSYINSVAALINAIGHGDTEDMAYIMSLRGDRVVDVGGEGYGGFCVPKDGLFLAFVLNLSRRDVLRYINIPDHMHAGVRKLVKEVRYMRASGKMSDMELEVWAADKLTRLHGNCREFFATDRDGRLLIHLDKIVKVFEIIGEREADDGPALIENLVARKAINDMIVQSERNVRLMTFYKVWMTYQAIAEAAEKNPEVGIDPAAFVAGLMTEYKPDTQDARFSTGMRKVEDYAQTLYHLTAALDEEQQALVHLMFFGFHWKPDRNMINRIARDLRRRKRKFEGVEIGLGEARKMAKNKIRRMNEKILYLLHTDSSNKAHIAELEEKFPGLRPQKNTRPMSLMGLSTTDLLFYTSDTTLDDIADEVEQKLMAQGLSPIHITACVKSYGGDITQWEMLNEWARKRQNGWTRDRIEKLAEDIGGNINALCIKINGPERELERGVQGLDVLDLGIPHKALLNLLEDPAKVRDLMLMFNPNSALTLIDGPAGGKKSAMSKLHAQLWFAVCNDIGREGVYRAIGKGRHTIDGWQEEMKAHRQRAEKLFAAVKADRFDEATTLYGAITRSVADTEAREAIEEEQKLFWLKRAGDMHHAVRSAKTRIADGLAIENLDFGTWLAIGGMYILNGRSQEEIDQARAVFDAFRKKHSKSKGIDKAEEDNMVAALVKPKYIPPKEEMKEEKKVEVSAKAIEIIVAKGLAKRAEMRRLAEEAKAISAREAGFKTAFNYAKGHDITFSDSYKRAMKELGSGNKTISYKKFGRFLGFTKWALLRLVDEAPFKDDEKSTAIEKRDAMKKRIEELYTGREVNPDNWLAMASSYERPGDLSVLGELLAERKGGINRVAQGNELFYVTSVLANTLAYQHMPYEHLDQRLIWRDLSVFFASTIHDHFYPYTPWMYYQSGGFENHRGHKPEMYKLAWERHKWLYSYIRSLMTTRTELKDLPREEQDALLSNYTGRNRVNAIGNGMDTPVEAGWRAYGALREIAFIHNDKVPASETFTEFDPDIVDADHRVNQLLMFPIGRTHEQRILTEGPTLARELSEKGRVPSNIIISRHAKMVRVRGANKKVMVVESGHMYLSREEYIEALKRHKDYSHSQAVEIADRKIETGKGIRVAVKFTKPIVVSPVVPFHENPHDAEGRLEEMGLPYTCQSNFQRWITYNKAKYTEIAEGTKMELPNRIQFHTKDIAGLSEEEAKEMIRNKVSAFAEDYPVYMVKDAAESGGRQMLRFSTDDEGRMLDDSKKIEGVDFIYWILAKMDHDVAVEEVLYCSPELYMNEEYMERLVSRQAEEQGNEVIRNKRPRSPLYSTVRLVMSTDNPPQSLDDLGSVEWHGSHPIILAGKQLITNVGRGGTLEQLIPDYIQPEHRELFLKRLKEACVNGMEAMALYVKKAAEEYERETGRKIGLDELGVSYGFPAYLMLDFIPQPIFDRKDGRLIDIEPVYDKQGKRIGSKIWLEVTEDGKKKRVEGKIVDWRMVLIEPNTGIGLWDRYWLRELDRETRLAAQDGRPINWDNVGVSARTVWGILPREVKSTTGLYSGMIISSVTADRGRSQSRRESQRRGA